MSATGGYSLGAKVFHWLTAAAIFCVVPLGLAMNSVPEGPDQDRLYHLHWSFGALVLTLAALRLLWRLFNSPPPIVADMPAWQRMAAEATHKLLYVLLFAVPLLGWAGTSAFGPTISFFGLFDLPALLPKNEAVADVLLPTHQFLAYTLAALVVMHIGAALHHHFIVKDDTLRRMLTLPSE